MTVRRARLCFRRESWGQGRARGDRGIDTVRYDETRDKSGFYGIGGLKSVFNWHVSVMRIKRINDLKRLFDGSIVGIRGER